MVRKFSEKLKKLRSEKRITQEDVASAIGVSRRAYIAYEQENTRPCKQETYEKLAKVFECDIDYLRIEKSSEIPVGIVDALAPFSSALGLWQSVSMVDIALATARETADPLTN